jgi:hypothetical protein
LQEVCKKLPGCSKVPFVPNLVPRECCEHVESSLDRAEQIEDLVGSLLQLLDKSSWKRLVLSKEIVQQGLQSQLRLVAVDVSPNDRNDLLGKEGLGELQQGPRAALSGSDRASMSLNVSAAQPIEDERRAGVSSGTLNICAQVRVQVRGGPESGVAEAFADHLHRETR